MKIGEVAKAAGMSTSRVRFYERRGLIFPALRHENGYRHYSHDHVALLQFIELAQSLGFTLQEISDAAPAIGERHVSCADAIALLHSKLTTVDQFISNAKERRARIVDLINQLEQRDANRRHKV